MQKRRGISLIVLVITIIVMIILAGAIILTLNNSGIIGRASSAVEETNLATAKDVASLAWAEAYTAGVRTVEDANGEKGFETRIKEALEKNNLDPNKYVLNVTTSGVTVALAEGEEDDSATVITPVPEEWKASVTAIVDTVPIPKGFVASPYEGEKTKDGGLVIYELGQNETAIPSNETQQTSWTTRNQYVWVPVDIATFDTTFVRKDYINSTSKISDTLGTSSMYWEVLPTTELNDTNLKYMTEDTLKEVQAMYASVKKYGGFYIARYEAGIDTQRTAKGNAADLPGIKEGTKVYSVMGKIPYTYIPWTWNDKMNEDTNGAVEVARKMYPSTNTNYGVVSTLTYGVQWDRTVQWFIDTGVMTEDQVNKTEGSTAFGNYSDHVIAVGDLNKGAKYAVYSSSLNSYQDVVYGTDGRSTSTKASGTRWALSTGALKAANINNIYDMAGNIFERTMEGRSADYRACRGGSFDDAGSNDPVAIRYNVSPNFTISDYGFRPSLYIK